MKSNFRVMLLGLGLVILATSSVNADVKPSIKNENNSEINKLAEEMNALEIKVKPLQARLNELFKEMKPLEAEVKPMEDKIVADSAKIRALQGKH